MWRAIVFKSVLSLNLKYLQGKVLAERNWQMVGMFLKFNQPELWLLTE